MLPFVYQRKIRKHIHVLIFTNKKEDKAENDEHGYLQGRGGRNGEQYGDGRG